MQLEKPQRLYLPSTPGERLKRPMESFRRAKLRQSLACDPVYLSRVRQCPCLCCGMDPAGEAAHLRMASGAHGKASGTGKKPDDHWVLPLCGGPQGCHAEQHRLGEREFWGRFDINPFQVAEDLYAARGDLVAMRAVVLLAIAERDF